MNWFDKLVLASQILATLILTVAGNFDAAIAMSLSSFWCALYHFKSKN